jgi:hypothetical protein
LVILIETINLSESKIPTTLEIQVAGQELLEIFFDDQKRTFKKIIGWKIKPFSATVVDVDLLEPETIKFVYGGIKVGKYVGDKYIPMAWIFVDSELGPVHAPDKVKTIIEIGQEQRVKDLLCNLRDSISDNSFFLENSK